MTKTAIRKGQTKNKMNQKRTLLVFTVFIFVSMLLGADVPEKIWRATGFIDVSKQLALAAISALMAFGLAFLLVKVLKVKINPK
jgi:hypothetical protein